MAKPATGRASIFRGKDDGVRVQGILTKTGGACFEGARARLRATYQRAVGEAPRSVSDADVIEFLARGETNTEHYLRANNR